MLNACVMIIVNILLNLRFFLTWCRLIYRHFDILIKIRYNDRSQCWVLAMHYWIVYWPESMELQCFLIVVYNRFHLKARLIPNYMINKLKFRRCDWRVDALFQSMSFETWQKESFITISLDKSMSCISIGLYWWKDSSSMLIWNLFRGIDRHSTRFNSKLVNSFGIFNQKSYVFDTVTM